MRACKNICATVIMAVVGMAGICGAFELTSNDFAAGAMIPSMCTCDGKNLSPHLAWRDPPPNTKSFALICHDPDAPSGTFVHWIVYDIPAKTSSLPRGGPLPGGARQLVNDFGTAEYGGPCPPSGTHSYVFTLYALTAEHLDGVTRQTIIEKIRAHQSGAAALTGLYTRKR